MPSRPSMPRCRGFGISRSAPYLLLVLCLCSTAPASLAHRESPGRDPHPDTQQALPALTPVVGGMPTAGDGDVHALANGWLVARDGALRLVSGGSQTPLVAGDFESIDAREGVAYRDRDHTLVSVIDTDAGQILVLLLDTALTTVSAQQRLEAARAIPEVACLHREPATGHVALFSVDARGVLEQRYVFDARATKLVDLPVREEPGVLDAEACAVDDRDGGLFLAEGPLGVWRLPVSAETDAAREPVMLQQPWGDVAGEIEDLAVDGSGALWVLNADKGLLLRRDADAMRSYRLPQGSEASSVAVRISAARTEVALFDESLGAAGVAILAKGVGYLRDPPHAVAADRVMPAAETAPVRRYGDAADDPAIYVPRDPAQAPMILATDKREGLAVYNFDGELLQMLPVGRVNNVDLLSDVTVGNASRNIAAASNRSGNSIALFEIEAGRVRHLTDVPTTLDEVYGLCMYGSTSGVYIFINDTDGRYQQYRLTWPESGPGAGLVREFRLPSQPEGCVADAARGRLYMGEEAAGVWEMAAEPGGGAPEKVISLSDALVADVEGMDIYTRPGGDQRLLVVSSQGSDSYAIYDLDDDYRLVAAFSIAADLRTGIDGVSETDGLAVSAASLPGYPRGVLVVQDGRNRMPDAPQNFKIIDWRAIEALLP